jgi:RNA polymerase sigma factor (sigma-70 family)
MGIDQRAALAANASGSGDLGELYNALSGRLERIVRGRVRGSDALVEDACQFAWSRLVHHGDRVQRDTALGWLAKTAFHEAFRLARRQARELSLEGVSDHGATLQCRAPTPAELIEHRQALAAIGSLPVRQQRVLWLCGLGLSYGEMARNEACTRRTVERQLARARQNLRDLGI